MFWGLIIYVGGRPLICSIWGGVSLPMPPCPRL